MWLKLFCRTVYYGINWPGWDFNLAVILERAEHVWWASLSAAIHGDVCITIISVKTFSQFSDALQWSDSCIGHYSQIFVCSWVSAFSCTCSRRIVTDAYMTLPGSSPAAQWHSRRPGFYFKTNTKMKCMILSLYSVFVGSKVANQF